MRTIKHIIIFLVFLVPAVLCVRLAGDSETTGQIPDSRHMGSIVRITADASVVPLDFDTLESLLRSDAIAGQAARSVLDVKYHEVSKSIDVQPVGTSQDNRQDRESRVPTGPGVVQAPVPSGARTALLSLVIDLPETTKPAAREVTIHEVRRKNIFEAVILE